MANVLVAAHTLLLKENALKNVLQSFTIVAEPAFLAKGNVPLAQPKIDVILAETVYSPIKGIVYHLALLIP